jgi:hypothetical protein
MDRIIPDDFNHRIISSVFEESDIKPKTAENYIKAIECIEHKWENYLIDVLGKMNINASVKSDKYSLPFKDEIVFTTIQSVLLPKAYYTFMPAIRDFVKTILERNLLKVRFYILIDLKIVEEMKISEHKYGKVQLTIHFRYYGS